MLPSLQIFIIRREQKNKTMIPQRVVSSRTRSRSHLDCSYFSGFDDLRALKLFCSLSSKPALNTAILHQQQQRKKNERERERPTKYRHDEAELLGIKSLANKFG